MMPLRQSSRRRVLAAAANERGVVLLIVLIVVALLTIIVTEFTYSVQIDQHRTRNAVHALQAQLLARSGVNLAEGFLMMDEEPQFDAYTEDWWLALLEFCQGIELEPSVQLRCRVRDESGKININNTRGVVRRFETDAVTGDAVLRDAVRCIFQNRGIDLELVDKLFDYWQRDPEVREDGTPQLIPDFTSLEDFGATLGIPNEQLHSLRNVLTAQPSRLLPRININTAPPEVLAAVLTEEAPNCGMTDVVEAILERQVNLDEPFRSTGDINGVIAGIDNADIKRRLFDVRSRLFRLEASALTNIDPTDPEPTGIGQTLSVLVVRQQSARRNQRDVPLGADGRPLPSWTLRPLDWQKEGGARLFRASPTDENLPGNPDSQDEDGDGEPDGLSRSMGY